ncbi:MAG: M48 family metalloprotease [Phycisphaerales bacterium JB039]
MRRLLITLLASFGLIALPGGCATSPATGKTIFVGMSESQERQLGEEAAPELTQQYGGAVKDPGLREYVTEVGTKLVAQIEDEDYRNLDWEFTLLDSAIINAFALPGGKVFITRGLTSRMTSEAQLAGVLGHEIGHVTARHAAQRMAKQGVVVGAVAATAILTGVSEDEDIRAVGAGLVPALAVGGQLVVLKYGRDEEKQSDELGMRYMARAGYNPRGQLEVMQILRDASEGPRPPTFLSSHPHPEDRIEEIAEKLQTDYAYTQGNPEFVTLEDRFRARMLRPLEELPPPAQGEGG